MEKLRQYRKKQDQFIVAVQLNLETDGFTYQKWGGIQECKKGDWLVDNDGEIYTVDGGVFERTYQKVGPGNYAKITAVWAIMATENGHVTTKEGLSHYKAGDYIVYNEKNGTDAYCMSAKKFESMYELDE